MFLITSAKRHVRSYTQAIQQGAAHLRHVSSMLAQERIEYLQAQQRARDLKRVAGYGFKAYSQNDEDGILQEIFVRIGTTNRVFVEFGCGGGLENNSLYLLISGWRGLWIDGNHENVESARALHSTAVENGSLVVEQHLLTADNIDPIISNRHSGEIDLLVIDVDGNDYWIWKALRSLLPRVVVIEYNATFRPPTRVVQPYAPDARWDGTNYFGASLAALEELGSSKGYALVGCNLTGLNAFFVRKDCVRECFCEPFSAENHYVPPSYRLFQVLAGMFPTPVGPMHRPGVGRYVTPGTP